jgi:hypothetical protein
VDLLSRPGVEIWEGGIERFTDLYTLQLYAISLEQGRDISSLITRDLTIEELDDLLAEAWERQPTARYQHLINHQVDGGYYLPADFAEPIGVEFDEDEAGDDEEGGESVVSFGSSIALQRELVDLEAQLRQAGVPDDHPAARTLRTLRTAADQSVANDLPIIVW